MAETGRKLILFTDGYPFTDTPEKVFIRPELLKLSGIFDITVVSCADLPAGSLPKEEGPWKEAILYTLPKKAYLSEFICLCKALFDPLFRDEVKRIKLEEKDRKKQIFWSFLQYFWAADLGKWAEKQGLFSNDTDVIFYTYWHRYYLLSLCMRKDRILGEKMKLFSRIHGYDLFDDQSPVLWQPFKHYMDEKTDRTFFVSEQGKEYFEKRFRTEGNCGKHTVCRLGVPAKVPDLTGKSKDFLLVSCASIYPVKHLEGIIEGIAAAADSGAFSAEQPLRWVHFGPGEDAYAVSVRELAEEKLGGKEGISFEFRGQVPNDEVIRFYLEEHPSCFITTSLSEGSPVSVQEAVSCALPVIGTNVGAMGELIDGNGLLLSPKPDAEEVKNAILRMYRAYQTEDEEFKKMKERSLKIWALKFDRDHNLGEFLRFFGAEGPGKDKV